MTVVALVWGTMGSVGSQGQLGELGAAQEARAAWRVGVSHEPRRNDHVHGALHVLSSKYQAARVALRCSAMGISL